ncbi:MAG: VOC family protein [Xanthobacteraceae bacterium]
MQLTGPSVTPFLWFDTQAEEAASFYTSVFESARIGATSHFGNEGFEVHGKKAGTVMTVQFEIAGQKFVALNGGPQYKFTEAVSFQIQCDTQQEIDHFWAKLSHGGEEGRCGWLKDKFGLSWQVVPRALPEIFMSQNSEASQRVMRSFLQMRKIDVAALQQAKAA